MRFVAIGLLAGILGVGCAIQPGEPTDEDPSLTAAPANRPDTTRVPLAHPGNGPAPASSSSYNPEPAPWKIGSPIVGGADQGSNQNPEPAPWHGPGNPGTTTGTSTTGGPETSGGNAGSSGNGTGAATPKIDPRVHHWDLWNETVN